MNKKRKDNYLKEELYELIKTDESIFDFIQESSLDGLWYWDLEKPENEWMNPKFWTVLGYNPDDMPHKSNAWQKIINPDDLKIALENFTKHCENPGYPYDQVVRYTHKDNSRVWIRCRGLAIRNENGKPIRMLGAHHDISEIKRNEQDLIKTKRKAELSERKFRNMFEYHSAIMLLIEPKTGKIIDANSSALDFYGYNLQELRSINIHDINQLSPEQIREECLQASKMKRNYFIFPHKLSNGEVRMVEVHSTPISQEGKQILFSIIHDITERYNAEKELIKAKEKAEEASRLKTGFINNISHEIRTPINGIVGFSEMLDKPDISYEKRKYFSKIVQNCSHQLIHIIDNILEISALETKQEKLLETEFCLNDLLMELFLIFNVESKKSKIPLYLKKTLHDDQSHIFTDKTKLKKILDNLLENAFKFTSEGFIEFGYNLKKENLILYVKDTGIGISPKNHEIIFERFSQEDSINHDGLGLGLSICDENAQLFGGSISLESEKGKGSTFFVTIPYKPV